MKDLGFQRRMDSALDGELSEAEWETLHAQLEASPEVIDHWERLQQVDTVFRTTPKVAPLPGFASRVMAAIAAMHLPDFVAHRFGTSIALALAAAALVALPLLSVLLILLLAVFTDPGTLNALFQTVANVASYVIGLAGDLGDGIETMLAEMPMIPALLSTVIPMTMLWMWIVWYLIGGRQFVTNRQVIRDLA